MNRPDTTPWTEADIERLAVISPFDIAQAVALIAEASPMLAQMIEAEEQM